MWKVLFRARDRFVRNQSGNVAILFAFSAIPLVGLLGGAVDVTRHNRYHSELLNSMDAAAIALVRAGPANDEAADKFVNDYIATLSGPILSDAMLHMTRFDAVEIEGGYRVVATGQMDTAFLPVVGMHDMPLNLETEVVQSGGKYEIVLALDNTGSMAQRGKIDDLKEAATFLVGNLYGKDNADDLVKMALVPFVTSVNIRGDKFDAAWLDRTGSGEHALDNFDRRIDRMEIFASLSDGSLGLDGLPTSWKGCVEARDGDYALDDTAPGELAATRWTPYLWPDDADRGGPGPYSYNNDYLDDQMPRRTPAIERMRNVDKYLAPLRPVGAFDESRGPNKSCAGPIVELTKNTDRMKTAIEAMKPHPGSGTNIAEGLGWGWRVLSPGAPFTEGVDYDDEDTVKALVLLSDGKNEIGGDYTGWGHLADGRLGETVPAAVAQANRNVETLCDGIRNVVDANGNERIRLYMILLQVNDTTTQRIFEDCASIGEDGEPLYYFAPDGDALKLIFADIGEDLTSVRVAR